MTDVEGIVLFLKDEGIVPSGEIVSNPSIEGGYFVPLRLTRLPNGKKSPSGNVLALARSSLSKKGYTIDFILIDEENQKIEESLRASLLISFPDDIRNSFFSFGEGSPYVLVETKKQLSDQTILHLEEHLHKFAELFSLSSLSLVYLKETNTATKAEILSAVRHLAPADVPRLTSYLNNQDLNVPSPDWLSRRLDALRKSNLVLRRRDGKYALSMKALALLGTRKSRRSPDIRRLLALTRQGS